MSSKIPPLDFSESLIGCRSHFLDSGAFAFWGKADEYAKTNKCHRLDFYSTRKFRDYVDSYAAFIKRGAVAIDLYSNVDVIPGGSASQADATKAAELSWRSLKYLENKHGLKPVPVIHYPTDHAWIHKHLEAGYGYVAIGGLVGSHSMDVCRRWIDKAFTIICDQPSRMPKVKVHGFGMTSYELLLRYPWYSVDSAYWCKQGAFGRILVPQKVNGKFCFSKQPYSIVTSNDAPERKQAGQHYFTISLAERNIVDEWLEFIGVRMGHTTIDGTIAEQGVTNNHSYRKAANLYFFREMLKHIPRWPWAYQTNQRTGGFKLELS